MVRGTAGAGIQSLDDEEILPCCLENLLPQPHHSLSFAAGAVPKEPSWGIPTGLPREACGEQHHTILTLGFHTESVLLAELQKEGQGDEMNIYKQRSNSLA